VSVPSTWVFEEIFVHLDVPLDNMDLSVEKKDSRSDEHNTDMPVRRNLPHISGSGNSWHSFGSFPDVGFAAERHEIGATE
jgi:hypothetical protein